MQSSQSISMTCGRLLEFEEDATAFSQGEPELLNGAAGETPSPVPNSSASPSLSDPEPKA